ncbi:MAG: hypothetical protein M3442_21170 [Chloroflexota bacterium]|nr:hypothetical protein [Chloroflexota bacterium]
MIAMELARELKVAGLPWKPRRGDLVMDRLNDLFVVVRDGSNDDGGVEIDTGRGTERKHYLMLTWIPNLQQLLSFLARYGPCVLAGASAGVGRKDVRWRLALPLSPDFAPSKWRGSENAIGPPWDTDDRLRREGADQITGREFAATDASDAAGRALHYLLAEAGWHPGPALSGW